MTCQTYPYFRFIPYACIFTSFDIKSNRVFFHSQTMYAQQLLRMHSDVAAIINLWTNIKVRKTNASISFHLFYLSLWIVVSLNSFPSNIAKLDVISLPMLTIGWLSYLKLFSMPNVTFSEQNQANILHSYLFILSITKTCKLHVCQKHFYQNWIFLWN